MWRLAWWLFGLVRGLTTFRQYDDRGTLQRTVFLPREAHDPKCVLTIVKWENEACLEGGSCYTQPECAAMGGIPGPPCARGFGLCCLVEVGCGAQVGLASSIWATDANTAYCTLTIRPTTCALQIRIDFINFKLDQPVGGNCINDRFIVRGGKVNQPLPLLCGENTGQHVYVEVDERRSPILVAVERSITSSSGSKGDVKIGVSQLCENSPLVAPSACLQYYTANTGSLSSFNYQPPPAASTYLNDLNYAICMKKGPDRCSIVYSNVSANGSRYAFELNNTDTDGIGTVPVGEAGVEAIDCPNDYIVLGGSRLCGQRLNDASVQPDFTRDQPVTEIGGGPWAVRVKTDNIGVGRGFFLNYQQKLCA